eukprot:CAMPEP_0202700704 /NCGR_PEP_ID=MMETSP1385-20130828/13880_1 /ASSEMBLY_ACC=CAM_ASM_000861 /TAXON_ID=933848 /ORGANISM="Elphidium margaritaceum" /LENGTH=116 /DNA_ID=CAMNT_0049357957 /DNA_START=69 /DNA_END=416 /DNA_ORIENTATION=-
MNFCDECNNLMFPVEDRQNKQLLFKCKHCANKITVRKNQKEYCVYQNYVNQDEETNIDAVVNPDVIMDPTLPRTRDVECHRCGAHEAVFFSAQSKNPDEAMSLVFVCTNAECKAFW